MSQQISFAPDLRKAVNYYHFSYRSNQPSRREFSRQDSLILSFQRVYDEFQIADLNTQVRDYLVGIIVNNFEIEHKNNVMLALATLAYYIIVASRRELTPNLFTEIFNSYSWIIIKDINEKKEDLDLIIAKAKATFFRYLEYVRLNYPH